MTAFFTTIKQSYREDPFPWILGTAVLLRILAAIFSGGYIASDDHFVVIHPAWQWSLGLPSWIEQSDRSGFSPLYPGAHTLFFWCARAIGITDTGWQIFLIRVLHALWSLPIVRCAYKIAHEKAGREAALLTGWLVAALWIIPVFSVRQLAEMVAATPLFLALVMLERSTPATPVRKWLLAGALLGMSITFRYQVGFVAVGAFIALVLTSRWKGALLLTAGAIVATLPLGILDKFLYGNWYDSPIRYFTYNSSGAMFQYIVRPWYNYILLILAVFIPPFSFLIVGGFLRVWRRLPVMFAGTLLFLIIHSMIPNKQERFIATILPLLILLGSIGIAEWRAASRFRITNRMWKIALTIFIPLNILLLIVGTFSYNKRAEILSLQYLQHQPMPDGALLDQRARNFLAPQFYLGNNWSSAKYLPEIKNDEMAETVSHELQSGKRVNYVVIYLERDRERRKAQWEAQLGRLTEVQRYGSSLADWILHKLNPRFNPSFDAVIYQVSPNLQEHS